MTGVVSASAGTGASVQLDDGFIGPYGTNVNSLTTLTTFTTLNVDYVEVTQPGSTTGFFALQGNDLPVTLVFHMVGGATHSIDGAIVWRETKNGKVMLAGFVPGAGQTVTLSSPTPYVVDELQSVGMTFSNYDYVAKPFSDGAAYAGDSAKTGVLEALNALVQVNSGITLAKTVALSDDVAPTGASAGDTLTFTMVVTNDGADVLTEVGISSETLSRADLSGTPVDLTGDVTFVSSTDSSVEGTLIAGESATYTVDYVLTQDDVDAGGVSNTATATGLPFEAVDPIIDVSGTDATNNTATDYLITADEAVTLVKSAEVLEADDVAPAGPSVGDTITYTLTVENSGNVTLSNVAISTEDLTMIGDTTVVDLSGDVVAADGFDGTLAPGATTDFTVTYVLTQDDVDAGGVSNTAEVTADAPDGDPVTDTSGTAADNDTATDFTVDAAEAVTLVKTSAITDDTGAVGASVGDTITYSMVVTNTGNVTLSDITIDPETLTRLDEAQTALTLASGPSFVSADEGSSEAKLEVGDTITFEATYVLTQDDVDAGGVSNTATANATAPDGDPVSDISGTDGTNDTATDVTVAAAEAVTLVKTSAITDDTGAAGASVGDTITYTMVVTNTGNVTLSDITIDPETLTRLDEAQTALTLASGPSFVSADEGSSEAKLEVGDTITFEATYVLTQDDVDAGGVSNTATANATAPDGDPVSDISGTDGSNDTATDVTVTSAEAITLVKDWVVSNDVGAQGASVGDTISYRLVVNNTGNVTLTNVAIASETLTRMDQAETVLTLTTQPVFVSSNDGSSEGTLKVGESALYVATYVLTQDDVDAGGVSNTAIAEATAPDGDGVSDISGSTGANDTPTDLDVQTNPELTVVKTATLNDDDQSGSATAGDTIDYVFTVINSGDVTMTDVVVLDAGAVISGDPITLAPGQQDSSTFTGVHVLTQDDINGGTYLNQATGSGRDPKNRNITALSGTDVSNQNETLTQLTTPGITVTDDDLQASENGDTGAMSFVLTSHPDQPVTLTFAGDDQCSVSPATLTFTPDNWNVTQTLSIIGTSDKAVEGDHLCFPTVIVASADPTYDAWPLTLSAVSITDGLINQIQDDLKHRLVDNLRDVMAAQSARISEMAHTAVAHLKAGPMVDGCGTSTAGTGGNASTTDGAISAQGTVAKEVTDCARNERHASTLTFALDRDGESLTSTLTYTLQHEKLVSEDAIRGNFIGAFGSVGTESGSAEGRIYNLGVNAGIYEARRVDDGVYLETYLAAALGWSPYDLSFGAVNPIDARGSYAYLAGFAGGAIAGDIKNDKLLITPRVGIDLSLALPGSVSVTAQQAGVVDRGTLAIGGVATARLFAEMEMSPLQAASAQAEDFQTWTFAPRVFCDVGMGYDPYTDCGIGGRFTLNDVSEHGDVEDLLNLNGEVTDTYRRLSIGVSHVLYFDDRQGQASAGVSVTDQGEPVATAGFDWKF